MKYLIYSFIAFLYIASCKDSSPAKESIPKEKEVALDAENTVDTLPSTQFKDAPHLSALHKSRLNPLPVSKWDKVRKRLKEMLLVESPIQGIDVSKWQSKIDWEAIKLDSLSFAICKATQGASDVDSRFHSNWEGLQTVGILRGAYHFYIYPTSPEKQATHFLETVGNLEGYDLPLILDIEGGSVGHRTVNKVQLIHDVVKFLEIIEEKTNRRPMIYTNIPFANRYLNTRRFAKYPLWISLYEDYKTPHLPRAWKSAGWAFWQKADNDRVEGIKSHVDFDVFNGDRGELEAFFKESNQILE